jgi:hypothetical protein
MNFQGFSPDSFEQFIRALALKVLGPGVTIFGNGPDGGREATFQGKVNYPHPPNNTWDGYGVIQAKFKEKPESTKKDQAWAARQLKEELNRWKTSAKRVPKPEYFIFCTNVELSSAANGGRAAVEKVFKDQEKALGLKAYAIWDANQLVSYIDGYAEIRQRFSCFFTPGDLLAEFAKVLATTGPNPDAILTTYLCREILADEDARLSQAGDRSEDRIRLASVFMDLPVSKTLCTDPPDEEKSIQLPPASLHSLLRAASHKLDPLSLCEQGVPSRDKDEEGSSHRVYGRFVFLGGPGSGKSTIGQFLAQIHRAALLDRRPSRRLEPKVINVIKDIKTRCQEEGATWPGTPRYPFRIELNAFAKALAAGSKDGAVTLSAYLRRNLSQDFVLTHEALREWLRTFPWLLILDGLDEVPSSSNRREVVDAIQNFLNEARDVEADLMIVASSRPDGYAGEFDGDEVAQRYLLPLSKPRALACAQRYVNAKTASKGTQRATEAMTTLTSAIENPLVARLMRSPLQVTFMVTVVAASGKPSESRWQLFNDYYRTIYERELHKAVPPFDQALNERRQDIDALHHRVGFILQCRAESSGGTQSDLSTAEFEQLVTACLEENGLAPTDLVRQRELILGAANQRLVFLTSRTPGRLSFDVRSLQEYMAAACMTNADSADIIPRLDTIAHSAYWRNTLLFAVGRFFVEPQMRAHRDKIRVLCDDLNRKDPDRATAKLGSRLALEILESGTIGNVPLVCRSLADCTLGLLANPPSDSDAILRRLADIYEPAMEAEFQKMTALWLGQQDMAHALSAWMLVLYLEKKGIVWAVEMAAKCWPAESEDSLVVFGMWLSTLLLRVGENDELDDLDTTRLRKLVPQISIKECTALLSRGLDSINTESPWLSPLTSWLKTDDELEVELRLGENTTGIKISLTPIPTEQQAKAFRSIKTLRFEKCLHADWNILIELAEFFINPCAASLANVLQHMANSSEPADWNFWAQKLPWPIACCLKATSTKSALSLLAEHIRNGQFAELMSWKAKEMEWHETGISIEKFCYPLFQNGPSLAGAVNRTSISVNQRESQIAEPVVKSLFNCLKEAHQPEEKNTLAWILGFYATCKKALNYLDPLLLEKHLLPARQYWWDNELHDNQVSLQKGSAWIAFYDHYGLMTGLKCSFSTWRIKETPVNAILQAFIDDSSRLGLLRLAGFWCAAGRQAQTRVQIFMPLDSFKEPRFRLAAMLVCMSQRDLTPEEAAELARHIQKIATEDGEPQSLGILLSAIEHHAKEIPSLEVVLIELIKIIPSDEWKLRARAEVLRNTLLQARPSGFNDQSLAALGLPLIETL